MKNIYIWLTGLLIIVVMIFIGIRYGGLTEKPPPPQPINITQEQTFETDCCSQDQIEAVFTL